MDKVPKLFILVQKIRVSRHEGLHGVHEFVFIDPEVRVLQTNARTYRNRILIWFKRAHARVQLWSLMGTVEL
jgi:hypothetical protein